MDSGSTLGHRGDTGLWGNGLWHRGCRLHFWLVPTCLVDTCLQHPLSGAYLILEASSATIALPYDRGAPLYWENVESIAPQSSRTCPCTQSSCIKDWFRRPPRYPSRNNGECSRTHL